MGFQMGSKLTVLTEILHKLLILVTTILMMMPSMMVMKMRMEMESLMLVKQILRAERTLGTKTTTVSKTGKRTSPVLNGMSPILILEESMMVMNVTSAMEPILVILSSIFQRVSSPTPLVQINCKSLTEVDSIQMVESDSTMCQEPSHHSLI